MRGNLSSVTMRLELLLCSGLLAGAIAHSPSSSPRSDVNCSTLPPFDSYHIHVLFWPDGESGGDNAHGSTAAFELRDAFIDHFNLTNHPNCTELKEPTNELCAYNISSGLRASPLWAPLSTPLEPV